MAEKKPVTVICQYRAKAGEEAKFEQLLAKHWTTLRDVGLATERAVSIYRGRPSSEPAGSVAERTYVEIFEWVDDQASEVAHQTPEVMALWEPMGACCEHLDFPHFDAIDLGG